MPHLAEELWSLLGHTALLTSVDWPKAEEKYLSEDTVTVAVQVNGKLRGTIEVPADVDSVGRGGKGVGVGECYAGDKRLAAT